VTDVAAAANQAAADRAAAEQAAAQARADRAAAEAAAEKAAAEGATAEKVAADKLAAEKAAVNSAASGQAGAQQTRDTVDFTMPDLVGQNLQVAQDDIQARGIFFSVSHDLLAARMQVVDSNWIVCSQTPKAGKRIDGAAGDWEGKIDFGVVKLTETCP
jgi:PASTA domain